MKRFLLIPVLAAALFSNGCNYDSDVIRAEVPGGNRGQSSRLDSAQTLALYHVTAFDKWGAPTKTEKVLTLNIQGNTRVGFDYVIPPDQQYNPDGHFDVIAYAGRFRKNVGPLRTINDHWYWAEPDGWELYWAERPERVLAKRATLY